MAKQPAMNQVSLSPALRDELNADFKLIVQETEGILRTLFAGCDEVLEYIVPWMRRVMHYNVPGGKQIRGKLVEAVYQELVPDASPEQLQQARLLGWCVEILQAAYLVADDIMDGGITRRRKTCWYRLEDVGPAAINDVIMLEHVVFQLLEKLFRESSQYVGMVELFHKVTWKTLWGQHVDTKMGLEKHINSYTIPRYNFIAINKTSNYTFCLPVQLAMLLADVRLDNGDKQEMDKLLLQLGVMFQRRDDFLDCFSRSQITGKVGTDIQESKCSWLAVLALMRMSPEQKQFFVENYGKPGKECVAAIKKLYEQLELPLEFEKRQEEMYRDIRKRIQSLQDKRLSKILNDMLGKIYKRVS